MGMGTTGGVTSSGRGDNAVTELQLNIAMLTAN